MCFATCCPSGWKVGGNDCGDFHVWVEDGEGIIYDPSFPEHKLYCKINKCDIERPLYRSWGNQEYWFDKIYSKVLVDGVGMPKTKKECSKVSRQINYKFLCCPYNALKDYCKLKIAGKSPKIVIGSMGWEKNDGTAHWEWG